MRTTAGFLSGLLFAIGLGVSGMTKPSKVLGFLNLRSWDPSLIFVMAGGILIYGILYRLVRRRREPLLESKFHVPAAGPIDGRLLGGAAIFGAGWGLAGYCPGAAIVASASGALSTMTFVIAMIAAMVLFSVVDPKVAKLAKVRKARQAGRAMP